MIRRLAILDDYQGVALALADWEPVQHEFEVHVFREPLPNGEARTAILRPFEVIVAMRERTPFPATLLGELSELRLLITTGMWNRSFDMEAAAKLGVTVCGTESSRQSPVELAWALILGLARHIAAEDAAMRGGQWQTLVGTELHGRTLGVLGLGRLGSEMARIGAAFGMEIIAWSQNLDAERARKAGATLVTKEEFFRRSDVITVQLALGERTRGLIGKLELGLMKPTAYLVNTSRGPIVDEDALAAALENGTIAGAALDVYDVEPLPAAHRLRNTPRTLLTPHVGITTEANYRAYYGGAVEDVRAWLRGEPQRVLNHIYAAIASP